MPAIISQPNSIGPQEISKPKYASTSNPSNLLPVANAECFVVKQKKKLADVLCGVVNNKYEIRDQNNEVILTAQETGDGCMRRIYGTQRPFIMEIADNQDKVVAALDRAMGCQDICCPFWLLKMNVYCPPDHQIGLIEQQQGFKQEIHVKDEYNAVVFIVKKLSTYNFYCSRDIAFIIFTADGITECGKIVKGRWDGFPEAFMGADTFGIQFSGINPYQKILLMGATFLLDYMFFEVRKNNVMVAA